MLKKILCVIMVLCLSVCTLSSCKQDPADKLPQYEAQEFEISGLWAPRQMTEEAFLQYKNAGFNIFAFSNHDELPRSSENQYYLGSKRTLEALKLCKKVGLDVYISYGDSWFNRENEGDEYFDNAPFSTHNYYGEYMDMIKGVRIKDEPNKEKLELLSSDKLIEDFKKIYPDKRYMINLIPETWVEKIGYESYAEMLQLLGEGVLSKFDNPYISVDVYPFSNSTAPMLNIANNYNQIAKCAKKYGADTTMILQSSTGNEFQDDLSEGDMRFQAYLAIAFGADNLQYYCYSVPDELPYNYCMLEKDNKTPSKLYYYVKEINAEIQKFASVVLAYNWEESIGFSGNKETNYRVVNIEFDHNFQLINFNNPKHYVLADSSHDMVISRFTSEKYGEAYMFVNFAQNNGEVNVVDATFKDCSAVAIYGGEDYSGTPEIVELTEEGKLTLELAYGEGVFITPII